MSSVVCLSTPCGKFPCNCKMCQIVEVNKNVRPNTITMFHYHGKHLVLTEVRKLQINLETN